MAQIEWMALVSAAAGAFLGSGSAFLLENVRQNRGEKHQQLAALQEVEFTLTHQLASLKAIRQVKLEPLRDEVDRHTRLGRILYEVSDLRVRVQDVAFLAGQKKHDLLNAIEECRTMYQNALSALYHREAALERAFYSDSCVLNSFDEATGQATLTTDPRYVSSLKALTDSLFECFDSAIESHDVALPMVRQAVDALA